MVELRYILQDTTTTESYTCYHTRSLRDALPMYELAGRQAGGTDRRVLDAELLALDIELRIALLEPCLGARLQLLADVLVEALDAGQVVDRNEGDLLDRGEALGDQQMRDDVLDVEGVDEHLAAGVELVLAAAGFLLLGPEVDVRSEE